MKTLLLALALGSLARPAAAQFPTDPPPAGPVTPARFPPFQETVLPNGLRIVLVESHAQPVLSMTLAFPAGSVHDPAGKEGLSSMVAELLTRGAGDRTAEEMAAAIEGVGGSLNAGAGRDFLMVSADVLAPQAALAVSLLADAVLRPRFAEEELELARTRSLSSLQLELSQPGTVASRFFARRVYGRHPYGRQVSEASLKALTREDLAEFQRRRLRPAGALLVIAGDITMAQVRRLVTASLAGWTGRAPIAAAFPAPPARTATEIFLVHRPGAAQSNIITGNTTFTPTDPRRFAAEVANQVLGGGADSRLFLTLREQRGWTYGAFSTLDRPKGLGTFQAAADVRAEVTDSTLREMLAQITRLGYTPLPDSELAAAKGALVGRFPLTIETANQVAGAVALAKLLGLPANYLQTYRTRIAAVSRADARAAARAVFQSRTPLVVVVGDATRIYESLQAIGPVRIFSVSGDSLDPAALLAPAGGLAVDLSKLVPARDSFAVLVQGNSMGYQRNETRVVDGGFLLTEETSIGGFMQQSTTVRLGPDGNVEDVTQSGTMQGKPTRISLQYAGGRVKGEAVVAGQPEFRTVTIDTVVAAGTLDDNSITGLLPALAWAADAEWTMNVFSAGQNAVTTMALVVKGVDTVQVPAGSFETYRAEMTGGPATVNFFVTTAAPHRLVKISLAGVPLEFHLAR